MYKYLFGGEADDDPVQISTEGLPVAIALAYGAPYASYGIDPIEACILIVLVEDFAEETGKTKLKESCIKALEALKADKEAYVVLFENGLLDEGPP